MILDNLSNLRRYCTLNDQLTQVIDFLNTHDLMDVPLGKVEINGDDLFANFQMAQGKKSEEAILETHNKMVDIQITLDAPELIGWAARENLSEDIYNEDKDYTLYPNQKPEQFISLPLGYFVMFFPEDAHAPCVSEEKEYRKVVFKLKDSRSL